MRAGVNVGKFVKFARVARGKFEFRVSLQGLGAGKFAPWDQRCKEQGGSLAECIGVGK
jgi:hypothetical protein